MIDLANPDLLLNRKHHLCPALHLKSNFCTGPPPMIDLAYRKPYLELER